MLKIRVTAFCCTDILLKWVYLILEKHKLCFNLINNLIMKKNILRILLILFIPWIGFSQTNKEVSAETLIQEHLSTSANQKDLQSISYQINRDFVEPDTKIRRIYVEQQVNGITVKGAVLNLNYAVNGKKAIVDSFKKMNVNSSSPSINAERALRNAMLNLGDFNSNSTLVQKDVSNNPQQEVTFEKGDIAADDLKARLIYLSDDTNSNNVKLTWETQLYTKDRQNYWLVYVDATNGEIISKQDLVLHCSFGGLEYDLSEAESKLHKQHEQKRHLHSDLVTENKNKAIKNKSTFGFLKESMLVAAVDHKFKVLKLPAESPIDVDFSGESTQTFVNVLDEGNAIASPYGWTKTIGAEFQDTKGNNVYSFYDPSPGLLGGAPVGVTPPTTAGGTGPSTWDYVWDLTKEPEFNSPGTPDNAFPNRSAAIVNLFYMNNMMHDIFYGFGFNEENLNYQEVNSFPEENIGDRGGLGNDGIIAQAQDGGGTNNANFLPTPDGVNGQMQMYLWTPAVLADMVYIDRNDYDADYNVEGGIQYFAVQASFPGGPQADTDLSEERVGDYVIVEGNSEGSTPGGSEGCGLSAASGTGLPYDNQSEVQGNIAIIDRGACSFVEKAVSAQLSGAIAAIVINNIPGSGPIGMGGTDSQSYTVDIPVVMIGYADGKKLKAAIIAAKDNGETISGKLFLDGGVPPKRDGDFDNGVIAHEYGHGISTRLSVRTIGGISSLGGEEQGGEGWSDFWGLYTTLRENDLDAATTKHPNGVLPSRGIGNYVTYKDPTARGIRPRPYSIDPEINGYTYAGSVNGLGIANPEISVPHGVGFVWCSMLYEVFQEFVDVYGFNDDISETGLNIDLNDAAHSGGNNVFNRLVLEGLKIQPGNSTFSDKRDAILAADALLFPSDTECGGSMHSKMIWEGFAKRGLGFQEDGNYGTNGRGDERDSFAIPPACGGTTLPAIAVTHSAPYLIASGENIQYEITVLVTDGMATDLVIVNQLPTGDNLTFVSATDEITPNTSGELIWNVGDVLSGSEIVKTVTIKTSETPFTTINTLFEMESESGDGVASSGPGVFAGSAGDKWALNTKSFYGGSKSWFVKDPAGFSEQYLTFTLNEVTVADEELVFFHKYATEEGFDGGDVEYTTNGAVWNKIAQDDFTKNGYNDTADAQNTQMVGAMFGGNSNGYIQSIANLPAGVTAVRFHFAADSAVGGAGWWIDDFMVGNTPTYAFSEVEVKSTLAVQTTSTGNVVTASDYATSLITDSSSLAVDDINYLLDSNVSLIPNPAHSKVSVVWSDNIKEPFTVEMVTLDGKQINVWNVKENTEKFDINLERYAQGFYILKIQRNDKVTFKKLVVN
jgi:extracellular elastinolytic metalloproteinase